VFYLLFREVLIDVWGLAYLSAELAIGVMICQLMIKAEQTLWQVRNGIIFCLSILVISMSVFSECESQELINISESLYGVKVEMCFPDDANSRFGSFRKALGMFNGMLFGQVFVFI